MRLKVLHFKTTFHLITVALQIRIRVRGGYISMSKSLKLSVIASLTILLIGCLIMPANSAFWLATSNLSFTLIRILLLSALITFTYLGAPPSKSLRFLISIISAGIVAWALGATYNETMPLLDGFSITASGIVMWIAVLEPESETKAKVNWNGVMTYLRPVYLPIERQIVVLALVTLMIFGIIGSNSNIYRASWQTVI